MPRLGSMGAAGGSGVRRYRPRRCSSIASARRMEAGGRAGGGRGRGACRRLRGRSGIIAVELVGGDVDLVIDLVGRLDGGGRGEAFGQEQARACRHVGRGVGGGDDVLPADDEAVGVVEEGRGIGLFDGDADADAVAGAVPAGMFRRARRVLSSQSNSMGLPAARKGPTGLRASWRIDFAGWGAANSMARMPFSNSHRKQLGGWRRRCARRRRSWSIRGTGRRGRWRRRPGAKGNRRGARRRRG